MNGTRPNEGGKEENRDFGCAWTLHIWGGFLSVRANEISKCGMDGVWKKKKKSVKTMQQEWREKRKKTNGDIHLIILKRVHGNSGVHRRLILNKTEEGSMERVVAGRPGCVRDKADAAEAVKETEDVRHLTHCRIRRNIRHKQCRRRCRGVDPADQRDLVELGLLLLWEC